MTHTVDVLDKPEIVNIFYTIITILILNVSQPQLIVFTDMLFLFVFVPRILVLKSLIQMFTFAMLKTIGVPYHLMDDRS